MINYELLTFPVDERIRKTFDRLPVDQYLKPEDGQFRLRRYHTGLVTGKQIHWDESPNYFEQSTKLNSYGGGIIREFPPIERATLCYFSEYLIMPSLQNIPAGNYSIGLHQIRIITDDIKMGKPAPEGLHQDGFDYITVSCIATVNIVGGNSLLFDVINHQQILFDQVLEPGQAVIFNDRKYKHYVSPIAPRIPGKGYRDVFVTTLQVKNNETKES